MQRQRPWTPAEKQIKQQERQIKQQQEEIDREEQNKTTKNHEERGTKLLWVRGAGTTKGNGW